MVYSSAGLVALIVNLIINKDVLKKNKDDNATESAKRYRAFLVAVMLYYISDVLWGILYEFRHTPTGFSLIYADTAVYFVLMVIIMVLWIRYVIAYLNKKRMRSIALFHATHFIAVCAVALLFVNFFKPVIFSFDANRNYVAEPGRYIALYLQLTLYLVISMYAFIVSLRSRGRDKFRYRAVCATCLVLVLFLILQLADPMLPYYALGCLVATCVIHTFVEADERKENEVYDNIATGLAEDYEAMYYIDIETGEYREFSTSKEYDSMNVPMQGKDFYKETQENAAIYAHPDDREFAVSLYSKETMLSNLEGRNSYSYKYRIMVGGQPRYFRFTIMLSPDKKHFVLCEKDMDDEITAETARQESQKKHITFGQIAESLASNYDVIYYVDASDGSYTSFTSRNIYGQLEVREEGNDFFSESRDYISRIVHEDDRDRMYETLNRDFIISALDRRKQHDIIYRFVYEGDAQYFRMSIRMSSDAAHIIITVENIDDQIRKEREQLSALNTEKELARRDELTGTKNKTAYTELERSVQADIDSGDQKEPFAIVVCDTNNLKYINDTKGHKAGDEYIRASAKLLCDIFAHSPVFRVGGDEFVVFLRGDDFAAREELMEELRCRVLENLVDDGPIIACGLSEYEAGADKDVSAVFARADRKMYENKQQLKADRI